MGSCAAKVVKKTENYKSSRFFFCLSLASLTKNNYLCTRNQP